MPIGGATAGHVSAARGCFCCSLPPEATQPTSPHCPSLLQASIQAAGEAPGGHAMFALRTQTPSPSCLALICTRRLCRCSSSALLSQLWLLYFSPAAAFCPPPQPHTAAAMWASRQWQTLQCSLEVTSGGAILFLSLNRPQAFNALSMECLTELHAVFDSLQHPASMLEALPADFPRVVVLSGAGRAFCGGVDIKV